VVIHIQSFQDCSLLPRSGLRILALGETQGDKEQHKSNPEGVEQINLYNITALHFHSFSSY